MGELLKDKRLLIVTGLLFLILIILIAGGLFGLSTFYSRVITVAIVLLLWMFFNLIERIRAARMASAIENSLREQGDEQLLGVRPDKKAEIEQLQQQLAGAIESLKKSKLSKGRRGTAALYALPWYLVIGPPASGKTTAIINSGLDFPYGNKIKGVGGTRNCDWFFSTSAVLLDTAGRYMTGDEDKQEWFAFLDVLKKYRKRMPINGVLVGISMAELLDSSADEIEAHAMKIRRRIDELITRLGVKFPVYLVFTKCDLLAGFVDFFQEFNRREREQIWGSTFYREKYQDIDPKILFEKELRILYKSLLDLRMHRLGGTQSRKKRRNLFMFPLQFASARENLTQFVGKLFQPNPYQESPIFRGFYFTSGTQEGLPIDKVIQTIAGKFGLPELVSAQEETSEKKSYFIHDLFTKIIIPDQNMGGHTSRAARSKRLARIGIVAASAVVSLLFLTSVFGAFIRSNSDLNDLKRRVEVPVQGNNLGQYFQYLDNLRQTIVETAAAPSGLDWNMSRGEDVLGPSFRFYVKKCRPVISKYFFDDLERKLNSGANGVTIERGQMYDYLKCYLLSGQFVSKLDSLDNRNFLAVHINEFFEQNLSQDAHSTYKPVIQRNVNFFVNCLAQISSSPFENKLGLVDRVRRTIKIPPNERNIYNSMIFGVSDLEPVTLEEVVGKGYYDFFSNSFQVKGAFTKAGWDVIQKKIKIEVQNLGKKDWVMGDIATQIPPKLLNKEYVSKQLQKMYFEDYAEAWWSFLKGIKYANFDNLDDAAENLGIIGNTRNSPLIQLLEIVTQQTRFRDSLLDKAGDTGGGFIDKAKKKIGLGKNKNISASLPQSRGNFVEQQFSDIHALTLNDEQGRSEIVELLRGFDEIAALMEGMLGDPGAMSTEYAAKLLRQPSGSELFRYLSSIKRSLRTLDPSAEKALLELFTQPILFSWEVILKNAQGYLNSLWRERVYTEFQNTLARNYPFHPQGGDAALPDLDRFFQPQSGIFGTFYSEQLEPFFRKWENRGIRISNTTRTLFEKTNIITKELYGTGGLSLQIRLQPELPLVAGGERPYQICLNIDGKEDCYRMGPPRVSTYTWPNFSGIQGAWLSIYTRAGTYEAFSNPGTWGLFRLLDQVSRIERISSGEYSLKWIYNSAGYRVEAIYKMTTQISSPFYNVREFFNLRCPQRLN